MSENTLNVELREAGGKGVARKLRATGRIPAILYGRGQSAVSLAVNAHLLERSLETSEAGMNTLFDLAGADAVSNKVVLLKDLQRDPVRGELLHADFYEVDLSEKIEVEVPLHLVGTPTGVSLGGGILDHSLRTLAILCLPRSIPDEIEVDVSGMELGDSLHVRDITLPEGTELRDDPNLSVASVVAAAKEEEAPVEAAEEAAAAAVPGAEEGEAPEAPQKEKEEGD